MVTNVTQEQIDGAGFEIPPHQRRRTIKAPCAFCSGKGRDPFGIMSALSTCQVCGGIGLRRLRRPTVSCAFCGGTGVHPGSRLTCTTCGGLGTVEVPTKTASCPCCGGSGRAADCKGHWPDTPLCCTWCGGKGVIAAGQL